MQGTSTLKDLTINIANAACSAGGVELDNLGAAAIVTNGGQEGLPSGTSYVLDNLAITMDFTNNSGTGNSQKNTGIIANFASTSVTVSNTSITIGGGMAGNVGIYTNSPLTLNGVTFAVTGTKAVGIGFGQSMGTTLAANALTVTGTNHFEGIAETAMYDSDAVNGRIFVRLGSGAVDADGAIAIAIAQNLPAGGFVYNGNGNATKKLVASKSGGVPPTTVAGLKAALEANWEIVPLGGDFALTEALTVPTGTTLIVPTGVTLTVNSGITLTVAGTLDIKGVLNTINTLPVPQGAGVVNIKGTSAEFQLDGTTIFGVNGNTFETVDAAAVLTVGQHVWPSDSAEGMKYTITAGTVSAGSFTIATKDTLTVVSGATLTVPNGETLKVQNGGWAEFGHNGGLLTVAAGGTLDIVGTLTISNAATGSQNGNSTNRGGLLVNNGTITVAAATGTLNIAAPTVDGKAELQNNGTITNNGTINNDGTITATVGLIINNSEINNNGTMTLAALSTQEGERGDIWNAYGSALTFDTIKFVGDETAIFGLVAGTELHLFLTDAGLNFDIRQTGMDNDENEASSLVVTLQHNLGLEAGAFFVKNGLTLKLAEDAVLYLSDAAGLEIYENAKISNIKETSAAGLTDVTITNGVITGYYNCNDVTEAVILTGKGA